MTAKLPKSLVTNIQSFTGRTWLLPGLINWWGHSEDRFLFLTGDPGAGKSMVIAWLAGFGPVPEDPLAKDQLVRLRKAVKAVHFCQASGRNISPRAFAESMANQLNETVAGFSEAVAATLTDQVHISTTQTIGSVSGESTVTGVSIGRIDLGALGDELSFDRAFTEPLNKLYQSGRREPILLLVDALDEAQTYSGVKLADLLSRLDDLPDQVRLLVSSREEIRMLKFFCGYPALDLIKNAEPNTDDVQVYVEARLCEIPAIRPADRKQFAARLAKRAGGVFLYATIVLDSLVDRSGPVPELDSFPLPEKLSGLYHAFLVRELGRDDRRWFEVYEPLLGLIAVSQGDGLTADQLTGIIGKDIRVELRACKQYLKGVLPVGPFQLFHRSFAEFLLEDAVNGDFHINEEPMHRRIADYFLKLCHDSKTGDSYGLQNLPFHAAEAGILDQALNDELILVMVDPEALLPLIVAQAPRVPEDVRQVYLRAIHHLTSASFPERASSLQMIARQNAVYELADRLARLSFPLPFSVLWTAWESTTTNRVIGRNLGVLASNLATEVVADVTTYEGRSIVVTGCQDGAIRIWDVSSGKAVGEPLRANSGSIVAVACGELEGRTLIVSSGSKGDMLVWDLALGHTIGQPLRSRAYGGPPARALAVKELGGIPVIVAGGSHGNLDIWQLSTGNLMGKSMQGSGGIVHWVGAAERENRAVILALHNDRELRIWDAKTGTIIGEAIPTGCYNFGRVRSVATATLGSAVAVMAGGGDGSIRAWDIDTGRPALEAFPVHDRPISALAVTQVDSHQVAITGDMEGTIRLSDLGGRRVLGDLVRLHDGSVNFLAMAKVEGRPVILSGGSDGVLRVSEVREHLPEFQVRMGSQYGGRISSLTLSRQGGVPVIVTGGFDGFLRVWDFATGQLRAKPVRAHANSVGRVMAAGPENSALVVSVSDDSTLDATDLETRSRIGSRLYGFEARQVWDLSVGSMFRSGDGRVWEKSRRGTSVSEVPQGDRSANPPGRSVSISSGLTRVVRVWSLATGEAVGKAIVCTTMGTESVTTTTLDGRAVVLASESNDVIRIWDLMTGQPTGQGLMVETHVNILRAAELEDRAVAVSADNAGTVRVFDVLTGKLVFAPLRENESISALDLVTIDGRPVFGYVCRSEIHLREVATGKRIGEPISAAGSVTLFAMGKLDGHLMVITTRLRESSVIQVWDTTGEMRREIDVDGAVHALAIAPNSRIVVGSSRGLMVIQWNSAERKVV